ncbi:MAG: hypothetical protein VB112_00435 [Oscillospiraceae bacterium]|nr:hypothetical protein [Oscillospiraceae bacterium]
MKEAFASEHAEEKSRHTWREAAREAGKNNFIQEALDKEMQGPIGQRVRELLDYNATLEKNADFKSLINKRSINRAKESKTLLPLTQARAESLGLDWYIWRTSEDQRVRDSHKLMDKVLCRFSDPPSPEALNGEANIGTYNPNGVFDCRCYAEPVILWKNIVWPHRVHVNGQIRTMSKSEFQKEFGNK